MCFISLYLNDKLYDSMSLDDNTSSIIIQLKKIDSEIDDLNLNDTHSKITFFRRIIERHFESSSYLKDLDVLKSNIDLLKLMKKESFNLIKLSDVKSTIKGLIQNVISEIEHFNLPTMKQSKIDRSININNHNTNNNTQNLTVDLEFLKELFKDNLTGKQFKELQEILAEDNDSTVSTSKLIDKIKNFGGDVASNIVAGLLTNPQVYSALF